MLEAAPVEIRDADILIIHTGWQRYWEGQKQQDLVRYFCMQGGKIELHSNQSLLGAVSVAGKRNFEARDKVAEMAVGIHLAARRDQAPSTQARRFGAFRQKPGNLRLSATAWWGWEDSNQVPARSRVERVSDLTRT
jgi:hypothetical protein